MSEQENHFGALGLPQRAALDADVVREAFQRASRQAHPDAGGSDAEFEAITRANTVLSDPVRRLKHLALLEFGKQPDASGAVSAETMGLFETVGAALVAADDFIKRRAGATSAIAKALLAKDEADVSAGVFAANGAVRARKAEALVGLAGYERAMGSGGRDRAWEVIGDCVRELAFLGKWEAQLGERMAALLADV